MGLTREHLHRLAHYTDLPVHRPDAPTVDAVLRAVTDRYALVVTIEVFSALPGKTEYRCVVRRLLGSSTPVTEAARGSALGPTVFLALVHALDRIGG